MLDGSIIDVEQRFTLDGSEALEARLNALCLEATARVRQAIGPALEAVVLGGGYGRGEGGVRATPAGDQPYNDLEFYLFLKGSRLLNEQRYLKALAKFGTVLSEKADLHVEFKIESLRRFCRAPISMFSYDLVAGHKVFLGSPALFDSAPHHLRASEIPLSEATRLLFNRFTGLLLTRELLAKRDLTTDDSDFCTRNLAKAELAVGDALLVAKGLYHWSCRERGQRLASVEIAGVDSMPEIRRRHARAVEFKLRPSRSAPRRELLEREFEAVAELGRTVWLWLEGIRMKCSYNNAFDYALCRRAKCPEVPAWRSLLLNMRSFGCRALTGRMAVRYPRERLLKALPLLLWTERSHIEPRSLTHLQTQLCTKAADWQGLVSAYKHLWPAYG